MKLKEYRRQFLFVYLTNENSSLAELFTLVFSDSDVTDVARAYIVQDGLLLKKCSPHGEDFVGDPIVQVVVPTKFRSIVLDVAHEKSGHPGVKKTYDRVLRYFFGPRLKRDISAYIKKCHTCQVTSKPNQNLKPVPLNPIPANCEPFVKSSHLYLYSAFNNTDCVKALNSIKLEDRVSVMYNNKIKHSIFS